MAVMAPSTIHVSASFARPRRRLRDRGTHTRHNDECGWGRCFVAPSTMNIELQDWGLEDSTPATSPTFPMSPAVQSRRGEPMPAQAIGLGGQSPEVRQPQRGGSQLDQHETLHRR